LIIGIDVGATITKAVSIENGKLTRKVKTRASDAVTAATGAFGKILLENEIPIRAIEGVRITASAPRK